MKSTWNNSIGNRERKALACLVTFEGTPHQFREKSIPGVCQSTITGFQKAGKWSNQDFQILHHDTTSFVSWRQDYDTGEPWPQASWHEGFLWLAKQAPTLKPGAFDAFIRQEWPATASKWDSVAAGEAEFSTPATVDQLAAIEAAKLEIDRLLEEQRTASRAAFDLEQVNRKLSDTREFHRHAVEALEAAKAKAGELALLDPAALEAETEAIWKQVQQLEQLAEAKKKKAEAEKKRAELGNSLGSAFAALGL